MAVTIYKPTSWNNEPITTDKLNQMTSNDQYLYEHLPKILYNANGVKRDSGIRMVVGSLKMAATSTAYQVNSYNFGNVFTPGTYPIVTVSHDPQAGPAASQMWIRRIGGGVAPIDHRGFEVRIYNSAKFRFASTIHFMAVGI